MTDERNLTDIAAAWSAAPGVIAAKEAGHKRLEATLEGTGGRTGACPGQRAAANPGRKGTSG